jgi:hypothetical protein
MPLTSLSQSPVTQSQLATSDDPTEEEIIDVALRHHLLEYREILPTVFGSQGRLLSRWAHMKGKIDRAKQEQKRHASVDENGSLLGPQAYNPSHNSTATSKSLAVQPLAKSARKSKSKIAKRYRQNYKKHTIKVKDCPQGKGDFEQPAPFGPSTKHNELSDSIDASTKLQKIDSLAVSARTALDDQNTNEQPSVPFDTTPNNSFNIQQKDHPLPVAPALSIQKEAVMEPGLAEWNIPSSAITDHSRSRPQQPTHQTCGVCRGTKSNCSPSGHPHEDEEILCSDRSCGRKWWGREYLWKYCGIELKDAWEIQRKYDGWWLCPLCLTKAKATTAREPIYVQPSSSAAAASTPQPSIHPAPDLVATKSGRLECELCEDSEIRNRFQHLTFLFHQYTTMVRNKQSTAPHWRLFDIPSVQDEVLAGSKQPKDSFIQLIRKLIQAPDGVLIKDILRAEGLVETKCSTWVHGVLSDLIGDFIFDSDQPFGNATLLGKTLALGKQFPDLSILFRHVLTYAAAGISNSDSERIVHDHRVRIARLYERNPHDSTIPADFKVHVAAQQQMFIENLNASMLLLVGGNKETQKQHQKIAKVATELKLIIAAYKGIFEPIQPQMNEVFKGLENVSDMEDPEERPVLVTTMIGIRYSLPGKPWRTCLQARVDLWPERQPSTDSSRSITLSQTSFTSPSNRQLVQSSSKKRKYDDSQR